MLKRPRGSSPTPPMPDPTIEADVAPYDLYEPDAKRRRYFAPAQSSHSPRGTDGSDEDDAELSDGPRPSGSRHEETKARRREWQLEAGEYRDANSLLHDLHAEQRHRLLFSSSLSEATTSPSSYHQHYTPEPTSSVELRTKGEPIPVDDEPLRYHSAPSLSMKHDPLACGRQPEDEAFVVSQRYEDVNRILRALVLGRRGGADQEAQSIP